MNLPKIFFNILAGCACIVTSIAGLVSCREDDLTDGIDFTIPGEDVTLTVPISLPKMDVQTRADIAQNDLNKVETLWIATFSAETGEMTSKTNDGSGEIGWYKITNPSEYNEPNAPKVELDTKSGPSYIVAVANVETNYGVEKSSFNGNQTGDTEQQPTEQKLADLLSEVKTWDQFLDIAVVTPSTHNLINAPLTPLPMAGAYSNLQLSSSSHSTTKEWEKDNFQPYTIPYTKSGTYEFTNGAIHLRRLVSQVTFNLKPGGAVNIIPHSYQVVNVPKYSWLYERAQSGSYTANFGDNCSQDTRSDYYSTPEAFIANNFQLINPANVTEGYTFNYWQSENKHTGNTVNTGLSKDEWSAEKKLYNGRDLISNNSPDFRENAPYESPEFQQNALFTSLTGSEWSSNNMATYVLISCTVEYTGNENGQINVNDNGEIVKEGDTTPVTRVGEATYLIHLGYIGTDVNDFNCYRNTKYTYNVTINGVDDIRVEAYGEGDTPGVEGMVDDSENPIQWLDCHYHTYNIKLDDSDLREYDADKGTGFRFIITTYDKGIEKTFTEDDFLDKDISSLSFDEKKYIDWVELRPTSEENVLASYKPRSGDNSDGATFNLIDASKGILNDSKKKSASGWYTLFIREYSYDPSESNSSNETIGNDGSEPVWKSYVYQDPRSFYIRVTKKISNDGQSIYTRSKYSGRQRSIMTYYDRNIVTEPYETGQTRGSAVGVEHINESYGLNLRKSFSASEDDTNGRLNCWNFTHYIYNRNNWTDNRNDPKWDYFVNINTPQRVPEPTNNAAINTLTVPQIYSFRPSSIEQNNYSPYTGTERQYYIEAISACMNRNRDNDGDGIIDKDEMRWYVPTMGKYLRILIGQEALSPDVLVNYNTMPSRPGNIQENGNGTNANWGEYLFFGSDGRILWAMEGYSTSEYNFHVTPVTGNSGRPGRVPPWQVRCIRNLGTDLREVREEDQTIPAYTFDRNTSSTARDGGYVYPTYYQTTQLRNTILSGNGTGANQMPVHTIAESYNSIYSGGFEISNPYGENSGTIQGVKYDGKMTASNWNNLIGYINENPSNQRNPCTQKGEGWRIPNVRELAIMKNLHVLDPDTPSDNRSYVFNIPFLSCSMGIIDGNGTKQLQVSNFNTTVTHNFMSALYQKHNSSQNYKIDFFITQGWFGGSYDQGDNKNGNGYYVRCVRDIVN